MIRKIRIGGVVFSLDAGDIDIRDWPYHFYTPFRTQFPAEITLKFIYCTSFPSASRKAECLFEGRDHWSIYRQENQYRLEIVDSLTKKKDRIAVVDRDFSKAVIYVQKKKWHTQRLLRPLIEIILMNYLAHKTGLLVHGAAIRDHDRGYVFIGPSGAGKTTISQFWAQKEGDYAVLGDERIVLRRETGGWFAYGTPWPGLGFTVASDRVPIDAVYLIRHGKKRHQILEAPRPILFHEIFSQVFSSFWDRSSLDAISESCGQLIQEVPVYQLPFLKQPDVTDFIQKSQGEHRDRVYSHSVV